MESEAINYAQWLRNDHEFASEVALALDPETLAKMEIYAQAADEIETKDTEVEKPTRNQKMKHMLRQAVPFFGFGVFDNVVMITVGDMIDSTFGVMFGFSTLAAAGFGQMVSDSVGITLQGVIDRSADKLGLPNPELTIEQERLGSTRTLTQISRVGGILIGCFVGMFPLLFIGANHPRLTEKLLQFLPNVKQKELLAAMETVEYDEGSVLMEFGAPNKYLYLITHGEVEVMGRDGNGNKILVATLESGDVFGEFEFLTGQLSKADITAPEFVRLKRLSKDDFFKIVGEEGAKHFEHIIEEEVKGERHDSRYIYQNMNEKLGLKRANPDNLLQRTLSKLV